MKLPLSLIKTFLPYDLTVGQITDALTLLGIEVDSVANEHLLFSRVVVGEVISCVRHPNAEKLQVAEVSDGTSVYTVVCAAANCRKGLKTAFAKIDATLTSPDGKELKIGRTSIRGVESDGMLCSEAELHLSDANEGIMELPLEMKAGKDLATLLWDPVFELSLTPNLGHCMSALGIARELSAALQLPLSRPKITLSHPSASQQIAVHVADEKLCPRYLCRLIKGVQIGPSPFSLQKQLKECGLKPINAVVDAANYLMMKMGQPFHVFDADRIEGDEIRVAPAKKTENFQCLDGVEREIPSGTLLISDAKKNVAIAGIMGGANSAVSSDTTNLLLEAAYFHPIAIRNGAKKIGLRSESAHRFEKGIDIGSIESALDELTALILELCGGTAGKTTDTHPQPLAPKKIHCRTQRVNQLLGTKLSTSEIEEIFQRLGFTSSKEVIEVPLYRADINEEVDLIEEVARIYGYNNIEKGIPHCSTSQIPHNPIFVFENEVRRRFAALGLQEFLTCDLISPKLAEVSEQVTPKEMQLLRTAYSKSEDYSILRTSLLPGILQVIKGNLAQKNHTLHAFEIGRIHFSQDQKVVEISMGAIALSGKGALPSWNQKPTDVDFFDLKGLVENFLSGIHLKASFQSSAHPSLHPGRQADLHIEDLVVGSLGEVHPSLLEKFDIGQKVFYAELNLIELLKHKKHQPRMKPLPQFPASERDWTVSLEPRMPIDALFQAVYAAKSTLLEKIDLIDLYKPEGSNLQNLTFRFTYRDRFKTISFEEVEAEHQRLLQAIGSKH